MRGRTTIASALFVVTALWTGGLGAAEVLEPGAEFRSFELVHTYHFKVRGDPPDLDAAADRFFKTNFAVKATFALGPAGDKIDLATDPVYVSFGSFATSIGEDDRDPPKRGVLRYTAHGHGSNQLQRLVIRQITPTDFLLRLRAVRLNIDRPDHLTLQIGDDVGQIDLNAGDAVMPRAFVYGVVAARRAQVGARSAVVRMTCPSGTCRRTTDDKGRFAIESKAGQRALTVDGSALGSETMSRLVRRVGVRPGTTDAGLFVLPSVAGNAGEWITAGAQAAETSVSYLAGEDEAVITIAAGANVTFSDASATARRVVVSGMLTEMLPTAPPIGVAPAAAYVVEPAGTRIFPCADVSVPNPLPLADGTQVALFMLGASGTWVPSAAGVVTDGGARIRADGALCELTSFFVGCVAELTSVKASVSFRGTKLARVPIFVEGVQTLSTAAYDDEPNVRLPKVAAGCLGAANAVRAHAALPLTDGYLSGASATVPSVPGGETDLGEIVLSMCGDGVAEGVEECDGADVGPNTCGTLGYEEGSLGCTPTCVFDVRHCRTCGNGIVDSGEECDGPDDSLCAGNCRADCTCPPVCGDGVRNQASERCDGSDDDLCPDECLDTCKCPQLGTTSTTLPPPECPLGFKITPHARASSLDGASGFEIGFTGIGHDRDVPGGHPISVTVSCAQAAPPCGRCTIDSLTRVDGRCANDATKACNAIDAADDDDCGGDRCDAFALPPLHNMWGGGPSCFVERLTSDVSGFIDNESGDASLSFSLAGDLYFGVSLTQPCPVCRHDDIANDGNQDGRCVGGASNGNKCDANGIDPTFGNTSFDCLPGAAMLGSSIPVVRQVELSTDPKALAFSRPCDFPLDGLMCPCATCTGNPAVACSGDADCIAAGTSGPCKGRGAGVARKPNVCEGNSCVDDSGDGIRGTCATAPEETFCDGMLFAHGTPFLPCLTNADCEAIDDACAGDCGECTIRRRRSCFLDPIKTPGGASPNHAVLGDVLCIAPGASPGLDQVAGLPGPERIMLDVGLRRVFSGEPEESSSRGKGGR